jgi:CRP-like cAMP-binding protein
VDAGDFLGEISLVANQPYNATAVAASDVQLVVLKQKDFEALIDRHPRIGVKVMRNIAISVGDKLSALGGRFSQEQNNKA